MTVTMAPLDFYKEDSLAPSQTPTAGVSIPLAVGVFFLVGLLCALSSYLGHHADSVAIWLGNGFLFAIVIRQPRKTWLVYILLGHFADVLGALATGETFPTSIVASICNSLEVLFAAFLLNRWFEAPFKLSRPRPLFAFLATGVLLAPAIACALIALWLALTLHVAWWTTYRTWFLGDALGMAIVAPLVYILQEPRFFAIFRPHLLPKTLLVLTVPILVSAIVFTQNSEPLLFAIFPALIFVVFRRGFPGAVMAVGIVAVISLPLTVTGHGALMLSPTTGILHRIVVLQIFLATALFTVFPIASLLEESASLALSLQHSENRYMELANTDALTSQANRRAFDQHLEAEWQRAAALNHPLSLLSLDIDHFKAYNDLNGHLAGDDCLRQVATLAADSVRHFPHARLYRIGGEEFAVILPHATPGETHRLAERIRDTIFAANIDHKGSPFGRQTMSVGWVTAVPAAGQAAISLLASSDEALYAAKHNGRNRCEAAAA